MNGDGKTQDTPAQNHLSQSMSCKHSVKNHKNWINFLTLKSTLLQKPKGKKRHRLGIIKER